MEKIRKQEVNWESLYKNKKNNLWLPNPHSYSLKAFKIIKKGKVLELGAGEGHDTIYFAKKGCEVTSVDISKTSIQKIKERAQAENLKLKGLVKNLQNFEVKSKYNAVISYGTLQFLGPSFTSYLSNLKDKTLPGGVHAFYIFGNKGDFYSLAKHRFHFPSKAEIKKIYKDWTIISFEEKNTRLLVRGDNGEILYNIMYKILVQKTK